VRICSLLPSATEILFGIGLGDCVVAVSEECDFPAEALALPRVTASRVDTKALDSRAIDDAVRAAIAAMQSTFRRIIAEGGIAGVERDIASVAEVFALQGDAHMREVERDYLR